MSAGQRAHKEQSETLQLNSCLDSVRECPKTEKSEGETLKTKSAAAAVKKVKPVNNACSNSVLSTRQGGTSRGNERASDVRGIIREQFAAELSYKEEELEKIEERIHLAKTLLQRLRLGVLAQHYGVSAFYPTALDYREETIGEQHTWELFEKEFMAKSEQGAGGNEDKGKVSLPPGEEEVVSKASAEGTPTGGGGGETCSERTGTDLVVKMEISANEDSTDASGKAAAREKEDGVMFLSGDDDSKLGTSIADELFKDLSPSPSTPLPSQDDTESEDMGNMEDILMDSSPPPPLPPASIASPGPGSSSPSSLSKTGSNHHPQLHRTQHDLCDDGSSSSESRFYQKKRIIVGNTSQYLDPSAHQHSSTSDGSTHRWMVYVRGPQASPNISHFVRAVRFFLHPSYHPNDIVRIRTPPFHLAQLGWGEFPVRVQLEFCDRANKPVDIIHNLVLDRTHTGQQTLGAETVVDLDLAIPYDHSGSGSRERPMRLNGISENLQQQKNINMPRPSSPLLSAMSSHSLPEEADDISQQQQQQQQHDSNSAVDCDDSLSTSTSQFNASTVGSSVTSAIFSPSSSGGIGVLTTNLDKCLHNAVRAIPICGKNIVSDDFYIPAPSLAQYRQWNIGRRRATEWERAVAIRKSVERKLKVPSLLSTKQVMQWCRQNGYTPLDPVPAGGRGFCKVCGCQLEEILDEVDDWRGKGGSHEEEVGGRGGVNTSKRSFEVHEHCQTMMFGRGLSLHGSSLLDPFEELHPHSVDTEDPGLPKLCSLSEPDGLVERMLTQQVHLEDRVRKTEEDVDICALPPSPSCARSRALVDIVPRFRVPQTPELKWIQQTASFVGIHIYPAVINRMYAHVIEHMIYISCARFLRGILGQAVQGAGQGVEGKLSQDRILTPFHVQQAILKLEHCDFLTNRFLGIQTNTDMSLGKTSGGAAAGTSSCSSSSSSSEGESSDEEEMM